MLTFTNVITMVLCCTSSVVIVFVPLTHW